VVAATERRRAVGFPAARRTRFSRHAYRSEGLPRNAIS